MILKCLKEKDANELAIMRVPGRNARNSFHYTIESYDNGNDLNDDNFLPDSIYNLFKSGRANSVPWILGVVSHEMVVDSSGIIERVNRRTRSQIYCFFLQADILKVPSVMESINSNWSSTIQSVLRTPFTSECSQMVNDILEKARRFYFGDPPLPVSWDTLDELSDFYSDEHIIHPVKSLATMQSEFSPVYLYYLKKRPLKSNSEDEIPGDHGEAWEGGY
jgi:carboxylesterase family protein